MIDIKSVIQSSDFYIKSNIDMSELIIPRNPQIGSQNSSGVTFCSL